MKSLSRDFAVVLITVVSLFSVNGIVTAAEPAILEECHLADSQAAAEEALVTAYSVRAARKHAGLKLLKSNGHASWRELSEAQCQATRDESRVKAIQSFRRWIHELQQFVSNEAEPRVPSSESRAHSVAHLVLSLPGSRGTLAWIRPERLNEPLRERLFELLAKRSDLVANSTHEQRVVQAQLEVIELRIQKLRSLKHVSAAELGLALEERKRLNRQLEVAWAVQQRRTRECQSLTKAITYRATPLPLSSKSPMTEWHFFPVDTSPANSSSAKTRCVTSKKKGVVNIRRHRKVCSINAGPFCRLALAERRTFSQFGTFFVCRCGER